MSQIQEEAARIAAEAAQLAEQIGTQEAGTENPAPTNYSSSVTSCTVDPVTGAIDFRAVLYPGDTPIEPVPAGQTPAETVPPGDNPPPAVTPDEPVGQVPAE